MTNSTERWNSLCKIQKSLFGKTEQEVQDTWETIFSELFGYSKLLNEIDSQRKLKLGSTERLIPDIILKNQSQDLFVVELKKADLVKDVEFELQIVSYLKQLHNSIGVIVCDRIVLIDYDYNKADDDQIDFDIEFTEDNPDGIKFIELFSKKDFSALRVKEFIQEKTKTERNITAICKELTPELINQLLANYFANKYSKEDFNAAINKYNIIISEKTKISSEAVVSQPLIGQNIVYVSENSMTDSKGTELCRSLGFAIGRNNYTWSSENSTTHKYWANPKVELLKDDWWILLNDKSKHQIHVFFIPKNTLSESLLKVRSDRPLLDLQINYGDDSFTDTRSKISFKQWFKQSVSY